MAAELARTESQPEIGRAAADVPWMLLSETPQGLFVDLYRAAGVQASISIVEASPSSFVL